jgi:hypothetical protein
MVIKHGTGSKARFIWTDGSNNTYRPPMLINNHPKGSKVARLIDILLVYKVRDYTESTMFPYICKYELGRFRTVISFHISSGRLSRQWKTWKHQNKRKYQSNVHNQTGQIPPKNVPSGTAIWYLKLNLNVWNLPVVFELSTYMYERIVIKQLDVRTPEAFFLHVWSVNYHSYSASAVSNMNKSTHNKRSRERPATTTIEPTTVKPAGNESVLCSIYIKVANRCDPTPSSTPSSTPPPPLN